MRKLITLFSIVAMLFVAVPVFALDLGANFKMDAKGFVGRTVDAQYEALGGVEELRFTDTMDEWDLRGEVGITAYNIVRLFGGYNTTTGLFNESSVGIDLNGLGLLTGDKINSVGLRTMYTHRHEYAVSDMPKCRYDTVSVGAYFTLP